MTLELLSVKFPEEMLSKLNLLVLDGKYPSRSEAIRVAIRDLILEELGSYAKKVAEEPVKIQHLVSNVAS